jgi:hypothetical protein
MILTIDTLAERYGMLPSMVLAQGSTLDIYIMDAALSYHDYKSKKANGKYAGQESSEELAALLRKSREQHG